MKNKLILILSMSFVLACAQQAISKKAVADCQECLKLKSEANKVYDLIENIEPDPMNRETFKTQALAIRKTQKLLGDFLDRKDPLDQPEEKLAFISAWSIASQYDKTGAIASYPPIFEKLYPKGFSELSELVTSMIAREKNEKVKSQLQSILDSIELAISYKENPNSD